MDAYFDYIQTRDFVPEEGETHPEQARWWVNFCQTNGADWEQIAEVGFNGGLSAVMTLAALPHVNVVSYDIGLHPWITKARDAVHNRFPSRHTLILGDSRVTLPATPSASYDMIFIDGGHEGDVPYSDLKHGARLVKPGGWIIMDDYCPCFGPHVMDAWNAAVDEGWITQVGPNHCDGSFGWVVGRATKS
jgi:predicted O-methyltransferase YrrM